MCSLAKRSVACIFKLETFDLPPIIEITSIIVCILLSSFFSASETALTSITPARAKQLLDEKGPSSRLFSFWINHPSRIISTILIGSNLVTILASALMTIVANRFFQSTVIAIVAGLMTLIIVIFGEVTPKTMARFHAEKVAKTILPLLIAFYYLFYPLNWGLGRLTFVFLRAAGAPPKQSPFVTQKELDYLIMLADKEGTLSKDKGKYLASILEFSKTQVREIMIPREQIKAIEMDADFHKLCQYITQDGHSRYPVYSEALDQIEGFLHVKDLLKFLTQGEPQDFKLSRCLRRPYFVDESRLINQVLNEMRRNRIHLAIVRNETQTVIGMITLEDILEEIIGEIEDEHDDAITSVKSIEQGILVDSSVSIKELKSKWNIDLPLSKTYTTLNGFLIGYFGNQPLTKKTVVIFDRYAFHILSTSKGLADKVRITKVS